MISEWRSFYLPLIVTIAIFVVPVITIGYVLWLKKPHIPCIGCQESDSMFYRCLPGTGKGSLGCDTFQKLEALLTELEKAYAKVTQFVGELKKKVIKPLEEAMSKIKEFFKELDIDIPDIPDIPKPSADLKSCKIDVINVDPCSIINKAVSGAVDPIVGALNKGIDGINSAIKKINQVFTTIGQTLEEIFNKIWEVIVHPFSTLIDIIKELGQGVEKIFEGIEGQNVVQLFAYQLIKIVNAAFPFLSIYGAAIIVGIILGGPIIGGLWGFFYLIYSLASNAVALVI